jgi:uncharacterized protein YecE (DUF72 family)
VGAVIRVGTCSFADETLTKVWYPRGVRTGEQRLRHYAERFDTVEIDASFYSLPSAEMAARWAERTPPGFVFHVKAFAMMTRHPVRAEQLPPDLRAGAPLDARGRVEHPSRELRAEVFARFRAALAPLREAGKLGGILVQLPPYIVPKPAAFEYLAWTREELPEDDLLVEFRHRSWLDDEHRAEVLALLEEIGAGLVIVDAPRSSAANVLPTVIAVTSGTAYVRMHGRNERTWNIRGRTAAERFDYLYSDPELREWIEPLRELSGICDRTYVMFNNNGRSTIDGEGSVHEVVAQAPTNALMLRTLLEEAGVPVSSPAIR